MKLTLNSSPTTPNPTPPPPPDLIQTYVHACTPKYPESIHSTLNQINYILHEAWWTRYPHPRTHFYKTNKHDLGGWVGV